MTKLLTQMEIYASPGNEGWKVYLAFLRLTVKRYLQEKSIVPKVWKNKTKQNKTKQNKGKEKKIRCC